MPSSWHPSPRLQLRAAEYAVVIASVGIDTHRAVRSVQAALTDGSRHG